MFPCVLWYLQSDLGFNGGGPQFILVGMLRSRFPNLEACDWIYCHESGVLQIVFKNGLNKWCFHHVLQIFWTFWQKSWIGQIWASGAKNCHIFFKIDFGGKMLHFSFKEGLVNELVPQLGVLWMAVEAWKCDLRVAHPPRHTPFSDEFPLPWVLSTMILNYFTFMEGFLKNLLWTHQKFKYGIFYAPVRCLKIVLASNNSINDSNNGIYIALSILDMCVPRHRSSY